MIRKASIRNFKCLRDVQFDLERFTVFVGPNASGKSSILQALDLLCRAFASGQGLGKDNEMRQSASRGATDYVQLAAEFGGMWYRYRAPLKIAEADPQISGSAPLGYGLGVVEDLNLNSLKPWQTGRSQSNPLPRSVLLRLEASKLVNQNSATPEIVVMGPDGTALHAALASMHLHDDDSWQRLQEDLRRVIPTFRRLRHTREQPYALLFDTVGADGLLAYQVSEGTLLVLGLLAVLHAADRPNLILLDDLDRGLHPKAQKELISLLRGLLETNPDLQIVASTHSPYMLDSMDPSEVRMTMLGDDGATACAALVDHPKFQKWKDEMTPGELWSLFGEKWLVEEGATA